MRTPRGPGVELTLSERAAAGFRGEYGLPPALVVTAPGRVNILGEHTDYQGGLVLPAAIDLFTAVAARPAGPGLVRAASRGFQDRVSFLPNRLSAESPMAGWGRYVAGTAWALGQSGIQVGGADLFVESEIPSGAGLSSSAALEVAAGFALLACSGRAPGGTGALKSLAAACQDGENEYCGVPCGVMDQLASCLGSAGSALLIDCRSMEVTPVPVPRGVSIVVCDSGERRDLSSAGYSLRRGEAAAALDLLRTRKPGIESLRDASHGDLALLSEALQAGAVPEEEAGKLLRRAEHIIGENGRVIRAARALGSGDLRELGRLMSEAHASLRDFYEVSSPRVDALVEAASALDGCIGARLTGGGFGGSVVCLVETGGLDGFVAAMSAFHPGGARLVTPSGGVSMESLP